MRLTEIVGVFVFVAAACAACSGSDDDTDGCDPGHSWVYEPGTSNQNTGESGFDHLFYPPDPICLPRDVSFYRWDNQIFEFYYWARNVADSYLDQTCINNCPDMGSYDECLIADCTAPDGTIIVYSHTRSYGNNVWGPYDDLDETLSVTPPAGAESWSNIVLNISYSYGDNEDGGDEYYDYFVGWTGTIHEVMPPDSSMSASMHDYFQGNESVWVTWGVENEALALDVEYTSSSYADSDIRHQVVVNGAVVEIHEDFTAWIDGECVGEVDQYSWEIIGECP